MDLKDAIALHQAGRLEEAERAYEEILRDDPAQADALHLLGVVASQTGRHERAAKLIGKAIALNPSNVAAHYNRGKALKAANRFEAAIESFDQAMAIEPRHADAFSERGLALQAIQRLDAAVESYDRAVALHPGHAAAWFNRGNALLEGSKAGEAVESYDRALALDPRIARAWYNRGVALRRLRVPEAAIESFERAIALDPAQEFVRGLLLMTKLDVCDWDGFDEAVSEMEAGIARGERASAPFVLLACSDSPVVQRAGAQIYVQARHPADLRLGPSARPTGDRIRVGYFSADFRNHPVSYLTVELLERHDRRRFEVLGFSMGPPIEDEMRRRVVAAFDHFVELDGLGDLEVARISRELGVDIAIDLGGHTQDARTGIFALRAAPLQASYVGYLGTMGADYYDYLLADPVIIPEGARHRYSEKIAYLPVYQANAATREFSREKNSREAFGLPAGVFAYCCFSNSYKLLPGMFACWMRILQRVEGSILMLFATGETMEANLANEALAAGIDPARIVFAEKLPRPEYLSRLRVMDVFLDTYPYNAGTVASDALWAGLPLLTLSGETFASRVAASVLHAAGLPELMTHSLEEYEERAVQLAMDHATLGAIRAKLLANVPSSPLFDASRFTASMEGVYEAMYGRYRSGLAPDHIVIPE